MELVSREAALAQGERFYFPGILCKRGHVSKRYVAGRTCAECPQHPEVKERARKYYARPDVRAARRTYRQKPEAKEQDRKYRARPAVRDAKRAYYQTPEYKARKRNWRHGIELSAEGYETMFSAQGNKCAICETSETPKRGWAVDHCHKTGIVRGILCTQCNSGIGLLGDDASRLEKAAIYLKRIEQVRQERASEIRR